MTLTANNVLSASSEAVIATTMSPPVSSTRTGRCPLLGGSPEPRAAGGKGAAAHRANGTPGHFGAGASGMSSKAFRPLMVI